MKSLHVNTKLSNSGRTIPAECGTGSPVSTPQSGMVKMVTICLPIIVRRQVEYLYDMGSPYYDSNDMNFQRLPIFYCQTYLNIHDKYDNVVIQDSVPFDINGGNHTLEIYLPTAVQITAGDDYTITMTLSVHFSDVQ